MNRIIFGARTPSRRFLTPSARYLSHFRTVEHVVPSSHTRHYPGAVEVGHEHELKLAVKQYIPHGSTSTGRGDDAVTLIGAHANSFPKELYEPMWDDLYERLSEKGTKIRSIWVADIANQAQSGILNETILGPDPSWWDHVRDLMFLINQKQQDMPQPLIAVGHSLGACQLTALSTMHPRLFQALVLIDPVLQIGNPSMPWALPSTYRRDVWPSREDAAAAFRKSKYYQQWDPRVLDKWLEFAIRDLPTELFPDVGTAEDGKVPVTLSTTKAQELAMYLRPLYKTHTEMERELYADHDRHLDNDGEPFYRPESRDIYRKLPEIYPPTRFISGKTSEVATPELRHQKLQTTGTGIGGNGGVAAGKVSETILDCGHLVAFEATKECAVVAADFIHDELGKWNTKRKEFVERWQSKTRRERADVDDEWKHHIGPPPERPKKTAPPEQS